jgi:hypothetical protein
MNRDRFGAHRASLFILDKLKTPVINEPCCRYKIGVDAAAGRKRNFTEELVPF